jgi:hypothetical protein
MPIHRLRGSSCGIIGQLINIPVSVDTMISNLPRSLDDDEAMNVKLKKNIVHKSGYLCGYVKKAMRKRCLQYLTAQPLYRYYKIEVDLNNLTANVSAGDDSGREEASDADNMEFMNVDGVPPSDNTLCSGMWTTVSVLLPVNIHTAEYNLHSTR